MNKKSLGLSLILTVFMAYLNMIIGNVALGEFLLAILVVSIGSELLLSNNKGA